MKYSLFFSKDQSPHVRHIHILTLTWF